MVGIHLRSSSISLASDHNQIHSTHYREFKCCAVILPAVQTNTELVSKPIPVPKDNESLIQLHAAAWNRRDYWITQGKYPGIITPVTLGSDGFGTVESSNNSINLIGENVTICPSINWETMKHIHLIFTVFWVCRWTGLLLKPSQFRWLNVQTFQRTKCRREPPSHWQGLPHVESRIYQ